MKVGLFIPCYVNSVFPEVGIASYKLLKHLGLDVDCPENQTCCGQPMGNAGFESDARHLAERFEQLFKDYDVIVGPSASCVEFVKDNYDRILHRKPTDTPRRIYEICEFLHDVIRPKSLPSRFPHKVSIQNSCHGVRLLGLSAPSELQIPYYNKLRDLLQLVADIEITEPDRPDECCGFGGMFSNEESAVSGQMGRDKVQRHVATGAEYIVGADSSCLMHQSGIIRREGLSIKPIHIVQVLAAGL